jgi:urea transport system permease protein
VLATTLYRFRTLVLAVLLIAFAAPAFAGPFEDAVAKFANDDFSDTQDAIAEIATSGNPLAYPIISALQDERLMADPDTKKVYIKQLDDKIIDAATGAPVTGIPDGASSVRLNNKLRRHVEAALGGLTLLSPDPATRITAAQSVFKSHEEALLPTVESALAKETNKTAMQALTEARAAIILFKSDASEVDKL